MARTHRKALWLLALGMAISAVAVTLLWPADRLVRPLLAHFGLQFRSSQRKGASLAYLHVSGRQDDMEFGAELVEVPVPAVWLWRRYVSGASNLVRVEDWHVRTAQPNGASASRKQTASSRSTGLSVDAVVREARSNVAKLQEWVPQARLDRGTVELTNARISLPRVLWEGGVLSADLASTALPQKATITAQLTSREPWTISVRLQPLDVLLNLRLTSGAVPLRVTGALQWQTNQVALATEFTNRGWVPATASARAEAFRIPASVLGLEGYQDLTGSLNATWENDRFRVDLGAQAHPVAAEQTALFPIEAVLRATGDTNQVRIDQAILRSPWLSVGLSNELAFSYRGKLLNAPAAEFRVAADLGQQHWFAAAGLMEGRALLKRGPDSYPDVAFELSGRALEHAGVRAERAQLDGRLQWPWLEIGQAKIDLAGGPTVSMVARADVQTRSITNGVLHVEGQVGSSLVASNVSCARVLLHANFQGPLERMSHGGVLELDGLTVQKLSPVQVRAEWRGRSRDLEAFDGSVRAGASALLMRGSANAEHGTGLRFDKFTLTRTNGLIYRLEQPFSVSLDRDWGRPDKGASEWLFVLEPFHWGGTERSVALAADVAWPRRGTFFGSIRGFDTAAFSDFFRVAPAHLSIDRLESSGSWTNGPLDFRLEAATHFVSEQGQQWAAEAQGHGGAGGLKIDRLHVTSQSAVVLTGSGALPARIEPMEGRELLKYDKQAPLELHVVTAPNRAFWDGIATWTRVGLVNPRVQLDVAGPLQSPQGHLTAEIAAIQPQALWTNRTLPRLENLVAEIDLSRAAMQIKHVSLQVEGQSVTASGQVPFGKDFSEEWRRFFLWDRATGQVQVTDAQLAAFVRFVPKILSPQGKLNLQVGLQPGMRLAGQATIAGAATRPLASVGRLDELQARLKLAGREVELQSCSGLVGGQPFAVSGKLDFAQRNPKTGMPLADLRVWAESIPLTRQPDVILRSDVDLTISAGTNAPPLMAGGVRLRDSVFLSDLRVLIPGKVAQPRQRPPYFSIDVEPFADWRLDLRVTGEKFLKVRSPFFRGEVSTTLKVEGTLREPFALGEVTINSGVVQFPFANLNLSQGLVSLTSADPYHPQLFVAAGARTLGYDVKMELTGKADAPVIEFTSTPPLSSEQVLLMLTAGEVPRQDMTVSAQQRAGRLALFLGKNVLSEFTSGQGGMDRLTIRSGEDLSEQGKQTYTVEYRLSRDWSIVGEYDRFGALNAELKWRIYSR